MPTAKANHQRSRTAHSPTARARAATTGTRIPAVRRYTPAEVREGRAASPERIFCASSPRTGTTGEVGPWILWVRKRWTDERGRVHDFPKSSLVAQRTDREFAALMERYGLELVEDRYGNLRVTRSRSLKVRRSFLGGLRVQDDTSALIGAPPGVIAPKRPVG